MARIKTKTKPHKFKKATTSESSSRRMGIKFLLICGVVLGLMVYPPLFTVRNIDVEGNGYLKKDEVINIAGVYFGEPMFRLDTLAVTRRIMNDLRIEEATVRRSLPSTIVINIKERVPIATVADDYGYLDLDHQGKIIDSYKTLKKMPIPMITGITLHDKYIGDDANNETLKQILYYLERLDAVSLNQISEVAIISSDYVVAYTTKTVQIRLGRLERLDEKAKLTADFLQDLTENKRQIEFIDFNYTAPFIKLAQ